MFNSKHTQSKCMYYFVKLIGRLLVITAENILNLSNFVTLYKHENIVN